MSDLFHEKVSFSYIERVFDVSRTATTAKQAYFAKCISGLLHSDATLLHLGEDVRWCRERESNPHSIAGTGF